MTPDRLEDIFRRQEHLQAVIHPTREFPSTNPTVLMEQLRGQTLAAVAELIEALEKCAWKPWLTTLPPGELIPREPFKKEMIDVLHFFVNLCLLGGISPQELHEGYVAKNAVNLARQSNGYDGRTTKCPGCNDALDDSTGCVYEANTSTVHCKAKDERWQVWSSPNGRGFVGAVRLDAE